MLLWSLCRKESDPCCFHGSFLCCQVTSSSEKAAFPPLKAKWLPRDSENKKGDFYHGCCVTLRVDWKLCGTEIITNWSLRCFFSLVWEREAARHPFILLPERQQGEEEAENRRWRNFSLHLLRDESWLWKQWGEEGVFPRPRLLAATEKAADASGQAEPQVPIWGEAKVDTRRLRRLPRDPEKAIAAWDDVELWGLHLLQQQPAALLRDVRVPALFLCCRSR